MTTRLLPAQCLSCKHWVSPLDHGGDESIRSCAAFPEGIPPDIWWNRADHRKPFEGDHGIGWEADDDEFPEWVLSEEGR